MANQALAMAQASLSIAQWKDGFGRNIFYLQPEQIESIVHVITATILIVLIGTYLVRLSICLFILQLLPFTQRGARW